jgi:hypothetical protein
MKKLTSLALTAGLLILTPTAALADDSKSGSSEQSAPALDSMVNSADAQQEKKPQASPDNLAALKAKAAESIAKRQRDLASWSAKLTAAKTDCGQNAAALSRIGATQASLTTLGASIAASTTVEAAKPLYQQVFTHQRVYLVVSPVVHTALACDNQLARATRQTTNVAELNTKIAAAKAKGVNTAPAEAFLAQVTPQIEAGKATATAAAASLSGLVPDQGNEATKAANEAAVNGAKAGIRAADASFDNAASLLKQATKALGGEAKTEASEKKAEKKAEHEKKKAEKEAEKEAKKAEREAAKANRERGKSNK